MIRDRTEGAFVALAAIVLFGKTLDWFGVPVMATLLILLAAAYLVMRKTEGLFQ